MKNRLWLLVVFLTLVFTATTLGREEPCKNPNRKTYNKKPDFCAPDGTRGIGITIETGGNKMAIPDLRCSCLPIALRYNNPGVLKTPKGGWKGQLKDGQGNVIKDSKGHAVFESVEAGIGAWSEWIKRRAKQNNLRTAFKIMSLYAPPDDCVGSIGTPPNCPYGINPTLEYAEKVAKAVNKGPKDELNLDGSNREGRDALFSIFSAIANFEIGTDFCKGKCEISREVFEKAMDAAWGKIKN